MSAVEHEKLWGSPGETKRRLAIMEASVVPALPPEAYGVTPPEWKKPDVHHQAFATPPGYEPLARILNLALEQSSAGKGRERHANGKPFAKQPILEIARMVGVAYQTGQVMKKAQEATSMAGRGDLAAAKAELLGVIVYAAAAYAFLEEQGESK